MNHETEKNKKFKFANTASKSINTQGIKEENTVLRRFIPVVRTVRITTITNTIVDSTVNSKTYFGLTDHHQYDKEYKTVCTVIWKLIQIYFYITVYIILYSCST